MAVYDSRPFAEEDLAARFPERSDINGVSAWIELIEGIRPLLNTPDTVAWLPEVLEKFDDFLAAVASIKPPSTPRVFVSHQQNDWQEAERVAWQATQVDFEYWLDVHDPTLAFANASGTVSAPTLAQPIKAMLIAAIIEMALLNSSHVVALHTSKSKKSRWIPYEFGRAKQRLIASSNAASWFQPKVPEILPDPNGDYLSLAFCAFDEPTLEGWFGSQPRAHRPPIKSLWPKPLAIPPALPK